MSNIFVNQSDPILSGKDIYQYQPQIPTIQYFNRGNEYMMKDWLGELDSITKGLTEDEINKLSQNVEYMRLSSELNQTIQNELMLLIKGNLNNRPDISDNIKKQIFIIKEIQEETNTEQRKNMAELNDYMKNYSHLTFNEYKNIKNGGSNVEITTGNTAKTKINNKKKENEI